MGIAEIKQRVVDVATPFLQGGERVEVASQVMVGTAPVKTMAAVAVATAVVSGGTMTALFVTRKQFIVLTDRRLLFFQMNQATARPMPKLLGELPRAALSVGEVQKGILTRAFILTVAGQKRAVKLRFPLPLRHDADSIADSLRTNAAG
jgi:hypothetical protein